MNPESATGSQMLLTGLATCSVHPVSETAAVPPLYNSTYVARGCDASKPPYGNTCEIRTGGA